MGLGQGLEITPTFPAGVEHHEGCYSVKEEGPTCLMTGVSFPERQLKPGERPSFPVDGQAVSTGEGARTDQPLRAAIVRGAPSVTRRESARPAPLVLLCSGGGQKLREVKILAQGHTAASRRHFLPLCCSLPALARTTLSLCQYLGKAGSPAPLQLTIGIKDNGDGDRFHTGHHGPAWQG